MNAIAEPIELLEAECNAHGWRDDVDAVDDEGDAFDPICSTRVLDWTVQRICAFDWLGNPKT
jgi:hypothetical protein